MIENHEHDRRDENERTYVRPSVLTSSRDEAAECRADSVEVETVHDSMPTLHANRWRSRERSPPEGDVDALLRSASRGAVVVEHLRGTMDDLAGFRAAALEIPVGCQRDHK